MDGEEHQADGRRRDEPREDLQAPPLLVTQFRSPPSGRRPWAGGPWRGCTPGRRTGDTTPLALGRGPGPSTACRTRDTCTIPLSATSHSHGRELVDEDDLIPILFFIEEATTKLFFCTSKMIDTFNAGFHYIFFMAFYEAHFQLPLTVRGRCTWPRRCGRRRRRPWPVSRRRKRSPDLP